ncbi:hypothetical protein KDK95_24415 [Actinospica sp. MGRD01-02]|uniref:Uncharacterized protein n=1 Tax=Actinospica acidithermotolerans TaxID=2828514 RepID=A0A941EDR1_9ACTN|nr:DUF6508 domain-containing protein [Actinospica acidithermotolerans]MBR7829472.1 hypothetical protein [Actinospica acidithermotolerans]
MTAMTAAAEGSDPDDATLLAALDLVQAEAWHALAGLAESFRLQPHLDDDCVWSGGYPQYGARVDAACRRLSEVGAVTPLYPWMRAERPSLGADGQLSPADAVRLATTIIRGERFGDGMIASALDEGILQAVIASLASWYDDRHEAQQR